MIQSFRDDDTRELFETRTNRRWATIKTVASLKLDQVNAAINLEDLRIPPNNRLEVLKKDRLGQFSIRINDQWRICFVWRDGDVYAVEITEYH